MNSNKPNLGINKIKCCNMVEEQRFNICLAAVKNCGYALLFVEKQTPKICIAAVKNCGKALKFVEKQTPEICLAAVETDGKALQFVKIQTFEICLTAVKQNILSFKYILCKEIKNRCEHAIICNCNDYTHMSLIPILLEYELPEIKQIITDFLF